MKENRFFFLNFSLSPLFLWHQDQNVTLQNLRQFVRRNSNFKIDLDDCLKEFDENAAEFMRSVQHSSGPTNEAETIVKRARNEATKLDTNVSSNIEC